MTDWVFATIDRLGVVGVGLLILLENLVPPIPSEVILPLAGFRARAGAFDIVAVWAAATAGAVAGALILYGLGAWLGYPRLRALAARRWFVVCSVADLERGRRLFDRHGATVVLAGRCLPFVRSVVSIPAGLAGMPLGRFTVLTTIGSGVWNAIFVGAGWVLGENWERVEPAIAPVSYVVTALVAAAVVVLIIRRYRARSGA